MVCAQPILETVELSYLWYFAFYTPLLFAVWPKIPVPEVIYNPLFVFAVSNNKGVIISELPMISPQNDSKVGTPAPPILRYNMTLCNHFERVHTGKSCVDFSLRLRPPACIPS